MTEEYRFTAKCQEFRQIRRSSRKEILNNMCFVWKIKLFTALNHPHLQTF